MRTIRTKVYKFSELSKESQEKAIEKLYDINVDYEWYESTTDQFKEENKFFNVTQTFFSGFSSQGDGAMFEYDSIDKNFVSSIIDTLTLPNWKKRVLKEYSYTSGNGKQSGHYYHYNSCAHNIYTESDRGAQYYVNIENLIYEVAPIIEKSIIDKYKELAQELYRQLEKEYYYLTSEEAIIESIEANEYEFTQEGRMI